MADQLVQKQSKRKKLAAEETAPVDSPLDADMSQGAAAAAQAKAERKAARKRKRAEEAAATEPNAQPQQDSKAKNRKEKRSKLAAVPETPQQEPEVDAKRSKKSRKLTEVPAQPANSSGSSADTALEGLPEGAAPPPAAPTDPMALDNFRLSDVIKQQLLGKGMRTLFPIQAKTLDLLLDGSDLVGRARTGCGKTLAFVLPIVERLKGAGRPKHGRAPRVIVLAPTRELAKQVAADFEWIGGAVQLSTLCLYGGAPYGPQEAHLRRGVDVVVGTPGRVKDHLERKTLDLKAVEFRILDECDEMLSMGFVDDVETILKQGGQGDGKMQTLLFSATLPSWVKDITRRFLRQGHKTVDLVGTEKMKASASVSHLVLPCHWTQRPSIVADMVRSYGSAGRSIVFCDTKKDVNELTTSLGEVCGAQALHGDIPQSQREVTLAGFRKGTFSVLVATDVAARGLDITGVELVVQTEPPKDPETYIHRSGRTGRAGSTGVSVTLVGRNKEGLIPHIERRAGLKFERIGAPQPAEMARVAGERAVEALRDIDEGVVPWFTAAAQVLLEDTEPERALALALAKVTGHTQMRSRSLLTAHEDYATLQFISDTDIQRPGYVYSWLRKRLPEETVEEMKRMSLTLDNRSAVFDVPQHLAKEFLAACKPSKEQPAEGTTSLARGNVMQPHLLRPAELPELKARDVPESTGGRFGGHGSGRGGFGGRSSFSGFGGRFGGGSTGGRGRSSFGGGRGRGRGR